MMLNGVVMMEIRGKRALDSARIAFISRRGCRDLEGKMESV
jgi:hypothetical protein